MNENDKKGKLGNLVVVITIILAIGLILSSVGYSIALSDKNNMEEKYNSVKEKYDSVNSSYNSLQLNYNSLNESYDSLQTKNTNLKQNYTSLQSDYSSLNSQYISVQQNYNTIQSSYNAIQSQYDALQSNYNSLQSQYNSLQLDYNDLESQYNTLQSEYNTLNSLYAPLQSAYSNLQSGYAQLNNSYNSLQNGYDGLELQIASLLSNYTGLQNDYNTLRSNYNSLQSNYNSLQLQYNSLNNNYNSLQNDFISYKQRVEVRYGWGENATHFVTPNDPDVISTKNSIIYSNGILSWTDMNAIFDWVWQNSWYNYDTNIWTGDGSFYGEFWKYPNETLSHMEVIPFYVPYYGGDYAYLGDCEDFSVLMASLCKAEENVDWLWCVEVTIVDGLEESGHACIFIDVDGNELYIYDPTNNYTSGISLSEQNALNQYRSFWGADSITVDAIFDENQYIEFNSNQEFFNFF